MIAPNMLSSSTFFLRFLSFFFFLLLVKSDNVTTFVSPNSTYCNPSSCGDVEIKYPFWLRDKSASFEYCGGRGLGIYCPTTSGDPIPALQLTGYYFDVKERDYGEKTVTLIGIDVDTVNLTCSRISYNLTLDLGVGHSFVVSIQNVNLVILYFNCTTTLPFIQPSYSSDCLRPGKNISSVSSTGNETQNFAWFDLCEDKVMTTVMKWEIGFNDWANSSLRSALNLGFLLKLSLPTGNCAACEESGGYCGYNFGGNNPTGDFLCYGEGTRSNGFYEGIGLPRMNLFVKLAIGISAGRIAMIICLVVLLWKIKKPSNQFILILLRRKKEEKQSLDALIKEYGVVAPKRYSYSEIKKMTKSFGEEIGRGGYGDVYRGNLMDGRPVAVKILNASKGDGEAFINEVASISRTSHVNVVTLLGFCLDGKKRALVYEFMPNGSLEKYIHGGKQSTNNCHLGWEKLYQIALGVARGLEYLHRGCNTRILHFDIKPHNILLDEDFCPKISDFGLAKQCARKESLVSMPGTRGTIGYIAPEVVSRNFGGVSHKSDVYSYGMMLLEMVGGRKNSSDEVSHRSETYYPQWVYRRMVLDEDLKFQGVMIQEETEMARKMIIVGLWCIQADPLQRPAISKVIDMLEGSLQALDIPPKPFFGSP